MLFRLCNSVCQTKTVLRVRNGLQKYLAPRVFVVRANGCGAAVASRLMVRPTTATLSAQDRSSTLRESSSTRVVDARNAQAKGGD